MSLKLIEKYHYILLTIPTKPPNVHTIDPLTIQQSLKSSLLQTCGQTASTHIDILSVIVEPHPTADSGPNTRLRGDIAAEIVIRISPSDKNNVLAAITTSGSDRSLLGFVVIRDSTFLPSLLSHMYRTG